MRINWASRATFHYIDLMMWSNVQERHRRTENYDRVGYVTFTSIDLQCNCLIGLLFALYGATALSSFREDA